MELDYIKSAVPEPMAILGLRLRPFCIGHFNLLTRFNCSFVCGGLPTIPDLTLGLLVCHQTFEEGYEFFAQPDWEKTVRKWQRRFVHGIFKPRVIDWPEKFLLFSDYLRDGGRRPKTHPPDDQPAGRELNAPWQEILMHGLWKINPNWTESDLLNMPLSIAWMRFSTAQEIRGECRFESELDRQIKADYERSKEEVVE